MQRVKVKGWEKADVISASKQAQNLSYVPLIAQIQPEMAEGFCGAARLP